MRETVVVLNRAARGGKAAALAAPLAAALRASPQPARLIAPDSAALAAAAVASLPAGSRVVVVGGDGSVHALLDPILARGHELAIVPFGSGDDTARALGLRGLRWPDALRVALQAPAVAIDTGRVQAGDVTAHFISSLCAGFDAAVGARALAGPRWLAGLPRYLLATVKELAVLAPARLRIDADGQRVHDGQALFASTLNTPTYGGGMRAAPAARIDDGRLDLLIAGRFGRLGALAMLPLLLTGTHGIHPRVSARACARLTIEADRPISLAADGEPLAPARRVELTCAPSSLRVVRAP